MEYCDIWKYLETGFFGPQPWERVTTGIWGVEAKRAASVELPGQLSQNVPVLWVRNRGLVSVKYLLQSQLWEGC